ncbi:hypothetical protein B0J14DRAFT_651572 [Halenospora varia]|nr:hypothetical protein B0J14DRAFT_651572 [Halenospora varia]
MAEIQIRVPKLRDQLEAFANGHRTAEQLRLEEERRVTAQESLTHQIQKAPLPAKKLRPPSKSSIPPEIPRRPRTRGQPPPAASSDKSNSLGDEETGDWKDRPLTPVSPIAKSANQHTISSSLSNSAQNLQEQLDEVKREVAELTHRSAECDEQIAHLKTRLGNALQRVEDTDLENAELREQIADLRNELRSAREEDMKLNDEIEVMRKRERALMEELRNVQMQNVRGGDEVREVVSAPQQEDFSSNTEKKRHRHKRSEKSRKEKPKMEFIRVTTPGSRSNRSETGDKKPRKNIFGK